MGGNFDAVYLLAAMADVNDCFEHPIETVEVNVLGVANVLEACVKNQIGRMIFSSTVWVYGLGDEENVDENSSINISNQEHIHSIKSSWKTNSKLF